MSGLNLMNLLFRVVYVPFSSAMSYERPLGRIPLTVPKSVHFPVLGFCSTTFESMGNVKVSSFLPSLNLSIVFLSAFCLAL